MVDEAQRFNQDDLTCMKDVTQLHRLLTQKLNVLGTSWTLRRSNPAKPNCCLGMNDQPLLRANGLIEPIFAIKEVVTKVR
jgi:hypothetical protein